MAVHSLLDLGRQKLISARRRSLSIYVLPDVTAGGGGGGATGNLNPANFTKCEGTTVSFTTFISVFCSLTRSTTSSNTLQSFLGEINDNLILA